MAVTDPTCNWLPFLNYKGWSIKKTMNLNEGNAKMSKFIGTKTKMHKHNDYLMELLTSRFWLNRESFQHNKQSI